MVLQQERSWQKETPEWLENWPAVAKEKTSAKRGRAKVRRHPGVVRRATEDLRRNVGNSAGGNGYSPMSPAAMVAVVARGSGQGCRCLIGHEPHMQFGTATTKL